MHGNHHFAAEILEGLKSFFRIHVDVAPAGCFVGSDRENGDVDVVACANGFEIIEVSGIAAMEDVLAAAVNEEPTEVAVGIVEVSGSPVVGWSVSDGKPAELQFFPDVHFIDCGEFESGNEVA